MVSTLGLALLLLAGADAAATTSEQALITYEKMTAVAPRCRQRGGADILVCGRRDADKYRVPYITAVPGDPKNLTVHQERAKLLARPSPCEENGPFLIGCGMVGVTVSTTLANGKTEVERPPAP
jgi:hypothetical protein